MNKTEAMLSKIKKLESINSSTSILIIVPTGKIDEMKELIIGASLNNVNCYISDFPGNFSKFEFVFAEAGELIEKGNLVQIKDGIATRTGLEE